MDGKDFESLVQWQNEKPHARSVQIEINDDGTKAWAYDFSLMCGMHCTNAVGINLEEEAKKRRKEQFEQLKKEFEANA